MTVIKTLLCVSLFAMAISACQPKEQESTYGPYKDTLTYEKARDYVHHYWERSGKVTRHGVEMLDTRAVWFSKGKLDSLINVLKNSGGDGIRFYLATYDTSYDESKEPQAGSHRPPEAYWGYNTLVMVSTYDSLGFHHDYFGNTHPTGNANGIGFIADVIQNDGELCPPPANCNTTGAVLLNY